jgi:hypothetical protein
MVPKIKELVLTLDQMDIKNHIYNWFGPLTRAPKNQRTGSKSIP